MPAYGTNPQAITVAPGDAATLMNGSEQNVSAATPYAGERLAIIPVGERSGARIRWEVSFSGNPGSFEVDIQEASQDKVDFYFAITNATLTTAQSNTDGTYSGTIDEVDAAAGIFRRPLVKSLTNNVAVTIKATVL